MRAYLRSFFSELEIINLPTISFKVQSGCKSLGSRKLPLGIHREEAKQKGPFFTFSGENLLLRKLTELLYSMIAKIRWLPLVAEMMPGRDQKKMEEDREGGGGGVCWWNKRARLWAQLFVTDRDNISQLLRRSVKREHLSPTQDIAF